MDTSFLIFSALCLDLDIILVSYPSDLNTESSLLARESNSIVFGVIDTMFLILLFLKC